MYMAIAIHHPHPDHVEAFAEHMRLVVETTEGAEGLLDFNCMRDEPTGRLLGVSKWESREHFLAAMPLIGAHADRRRPEWTVAEDELLQLEPV